MKQPCFNISLETDQSTTAVITSVPSKRESDVPYFRLIMLIRFSFVHFRRAMASSCCFSCSHATHSCDVTNVTRLLLVSPFIFAPCVCRCVSARRSTIRNTSLCIYQRANTKPIHTMCDIPSDIDYKDQALTPEQLHRGERVPVSSRNGEQQRVPSNIQYKDQGLTLQELQQRNRRDQNPTTIPFLRMLHHLRCTRRNLRLQSVKIQPRRPSFGRKWPQ